MEKGRWALPWGVSLALHLGMVLLALSLVWSVQAPQSDNQWVVPEAHLGRTPPIPLKMQRVEQTAPSTLPPLAASQNPTATERTGSAPDSAALFDAPPAESPFAAPPLDTPLEVSFYGAGGNARDIVYVIDASGSLIDSFEFVLAELRRSINGLSAEQRFTVVFFQNDKLIEPPPGGLKRAEPRVKQEVLAWIAPGAGRVTPVGSSNPLKAIERAMGYRPHLVYLLSDEITGRGVYELDQQSLLAAIGKANVQHTRINTIQFLYPDPLTAQGRKGTMELIALTTGGRYRFVDARELGVE